MSWKPQVFVEGAWVGNGLAFATKAEAENSADDLCQRWYVPTGWRAVESEEPVNYRYTDRRLEALDCPVTPLAAATTCKVAAAADKEDN